MGIFFLECVYVCLVCNWIFTSVSWVWYTQYTTFKPLLIKLFTQAKYFWLNLCKEQKGNNFTVKKEGRKQNKKGVGVGNAPNKKRVLMKKRVTQNFENGSNSLKLAWACKTISNRLPLCTASDNSLKQQTHMHTHTHTHKAEPAASIKPTASSKN